MGVFGGPREYSMKKFTTAGGTTKHFGECLVCDYATPYYSMKYEATVAIKLHLTAIHGRKP